MSTMNLTLNPSVATGLSSRSQIARRVTEDWAENNLFCLACPSETIVAEKPNSPVRDFVCPQCDTSYQLKGKNGRHGNVVANSAYDPKIAAIRRGNAPNYAFLNYSRDDWKVTNLFVVPSHFITETVVRPRNPLSSAARRSGWTGSSILLSKLPPDGRIVVVSNGSPIDPEIVRNNWNKFRFLKNEPQAADGWGMEVLASVRQLQTATGQDYFTLRTFYTTFRDTLAAQHPENHNIDARIRRQLQLLRDNDILEFLGRGRYRIIG